MLVSLFLSGCSGESGVTTTPQPEGVSFLSIEPGEETLPLGRAVSFTATADLPTGDVEDATARAEWSSSDPSVVSVDGNGRATGVGVGQADVVARLGSQVARAPVTVSDAILEELLLSPSNPLVSVGHEQQFVALGKFSDGTVMDISETAVFTSSNGSVAVQGRGDVEALAAGQSTITARDGIDPSVQDTSELTVAPGALESVFLQPAGTSGQNLSMVAGTRGQFQAFARFSNGRVLDITPRANWSNSNNSVIVNGKGLARAGRQAGRSTVISASFRGQRASETVSVVSPSPVSLSVYSTDNGVDQGSTLQYVAKVYLNDNTVRDVSSQVTWSVNASPSVATMSASGLLTAVTGSTDTAVVSGTYQGLTGQITVVLNPVADPNPVTFEIMNNSGVPDEAVFLYQRGTAASGDFFYNNFSGTVTTSLFVPQTGGPQYSFPLASLTKVANHTYTFGSPSQNMGSARCLVSLGSPLSASQGSDPTQITDPSFAPGAAGSTIPFDFYEPNAVTGPALFVDTSNVDSFCLGLELDIQGTNDFKFGFKKGRSAIINALARDADFSQCIYKNGFTTVRAFSPGDVIASNPNSSLATFLDSAIQSAWSLYQGSTNPNIPMAGWQYGSAVFTPTTGAADCINVESAGETINLAQPTTTEVFQCEITPGTLNQPVLAALLGSAINRGVGDDYSKWGNSTPPNAGYPKQYYKSSQPYNHYAEILHFCSQLAIYPGVPGKAPLCYAFPYDDHYHQDASSGTIQNSDITRVVVTIPPFDWAR